MNDEKDVWESSKDATGREYCNSLLSILLNKSLLNRIDHGSRSARDPNFVVDMG